ncbi:MAG: hypothetical protein IJB92_09060, partial [Clostridia bacterium]|nr:hypothetical protein [Clostridia bacterium]
MVLLTQNELNEVISFRDQIIGFAKNYESVGSAALAIMDLTFGKLLPNGMETRQCGWELGKLAAGMTAFFSEYMLESEYMERVKSLLASEKLNLDQKYWLVCFLVEKGSDEEYHRFVCVHLFNIDYSAALNLNLTAALADIANTSDDWKRRKIEEAMKGLKAGPIARRLVTYADDELLNCDPIGAMDVVGGRMADILLDAEMHLINMSCVYIASALGKISCIPKTVLPKGIAYFYKAEGQPSDAYNASYRYVSPEVYENTKHIDREITKRLKVMKNIVYDRKLPALDPSLIEHIPMSVWEVSKKRP